MEQSARLTSVFAIASNKDLLLQWNTARFDEKSTVSSSIQTGQPSNALLFEMFTAFVPSNLATNTSEFLLFVVISQLTPGVSITLRKQIFFPLGEIDGNVLTVLNEVICFCSYHQYSCRIKSITLCQID